MSKRNNAIAATSSLTIIAKDPCELKMLEREKPDLSRIYYAPLTEVLQEKDLPIVE